MNSPLIQNRDGFALGYTQLAKIDEEKNALMNMAVLKLAPHSSFVFEPGLETAALLLSGSVHFVFAGQEFFAERYNFFDEHPRAAHVNAKTKLTIQAQSDCELIIVQAHNERMFDNTFFSETNMIENDPRGRGVLDNTAYRMVRTLFDYRNRPDANLVLGEVVTPPGRWSSYPPHHHVQPELYHYRFSEPQGYGHAELDERVFAIKNYDTLKIYHQEEHAQVTAPGYAMMYVWAICHIKDTPYRMPTFNRHHEWARDASANQRVWHPQW